MWTASWWGPWLVCVCVCCIFSRPSCMYVCASLCIYACSHWFDDRYFVFQMAESEYFLTFRISMSVVLSYWVGSIPIRGTSKHISYPLNCYSIAGWRPPMPVGNGRTAVKIVSMISFGMIGDCLIWIMGNLLWSFVLGKPSQRLGTKLIYNNIHILM